MKLNDSEKKLLDALLEGVEDVNDESQYLKVYDSNFDELRKDVNDSISTVLSQAGLDIAEQKRLIQAADSPATLQNAIRRLSVIANNLMSSGVSILTWLSSKMPYRDSKTVEEEQEVEDKPTDFLKFLGKHTPKNR